MQSKIELLARLSHEVNRAYCKTIGDTNHAPWEATPPEIQDSVRNGVRLLLENYTLTPAEMHEHWYKYKKQQGWRLGPVKDFEKKEHPAMVHYDQLPPEQRARDELFRTVVLEGLRLVE